MRGSMTIWWWWFQQTVAWIKMSVKERKPRENFDKRERENKIERVHVKNEREREVQYG